MQPLLPRSLRGKAPAPAPHPKGWSPAPHCIPCSQRERCRAVRSRAASTRMLLPTSTLSHAPSPSEHRRPPATPRSPSGCRCRPCAPVSSAFFERARPHTSPSSPGCPPSVQQQRQASRRGSPLYALLAAGMCAQGTAPVPSGALSSAFLQYDLTTEILLRSQIIVRATAQRDVLGAPSRAGGCGMKLESGLLATALASRVDMAATRVVSLPDTGAHFGGDVPAACR